MGRRYTPPGDGELPLMPKSNRCNAALLSASILLSLVSSSVAQVTYTTIDLNPAGYADSYGLAINANTIAGYGSTSASPHTAYRALLLDRTSGTATDLTPTNFASAYVYGAAGSQQVGTGFVAGTGGSQTAHALLWSGTASSAVDLNPAGFSQSQAYGAASGQQVGIGVSSTDGRQHALLWGGTAASAVDLNPTGFDSSIAWATSGTQQVGSALPHGSGEGGGAHAMLWSGSASNFVDLHPTGFTDSVARAISGTQQAGDGTTGGASPQTHALLWSGTAASAIDLNPANFDFSSATGISNGREAGYGVPSGMIPGQYHALLWTGSASGAVDLQQFLYPRYTYSQATAVDSQGNVVGYALDSTDSNWHATEWVRAITGDANLDGSVGFVDLLTVAQHYQQTNAGWAQGDFNRDGTVDFTDLLLVAQNYGQTLGASTLEAVPEPTLITALLALPVLLRRRRQGLM